MYQARIYVMNKTLHPTRHSAIALFNVTSSVIPLITRLPINILGVAKIRNCLPSATLSAKAGG
jgi:hypothetical protein